MAPHLTEEATELYRGPWQSRGLGPESCSPHSQSRHGGEQKSSGTPAQGHDSCGDPESSRPCRVPSQEDPWEDREQATPADLTPCWPRLEGHPRVLSGPTALGERPVSC